MPNQPLPLFNIRLSNKDKARWTLAAEQDGRTVSGLVKLAVETYIANLDSLCVAESRVLCVSPECGRLEYPEKVSDSGLCRKCVLEQYLESDKDSPSRRLDLVSTP